MKHIVKLLMVLVLISCDKVKDDCVYKLVTDQLAEAVAKEKECNPEKFKEVFDKVLVKTKLCSENVQISGINISSIACMVAPSIVRAISDQGEDYFECKLDLKPEETVKKLLKCE